MNTQKYLVLSLLLPSLFFPQWSGNGFAEAKLDDTSSALEAFVESPANSGQLVQDDQPASTVQENTFIEQTSVITTITINNISESITPTQIAQTKTVIITAYSSTPDQTDATPFITAAGTHVRDGIIATNFLKFGTKVKIPELFGDKVFTVEDRMAPKNNHKIDIWFPDRQSALEFGVQKAEVAVLF